ncbi:MAG: TonB-dependent receptor [Gemmatimonadota bacterium]|nr:TonB-dependent receptor [Gemmatimonadota bacterium]
MRILRAASRSLPLFLLLALSTRTPLDAQLRIRSDSLRGDTLVYLLKPIEVTATRTAREVFLTPAPVSVVTAATLQDRSAETVTDLFRTLPGLDVTGVGVQQPRPVIRGLRGQRILLLQDGIRLNNARRQQDFGEVPALSDVATVERVEVVRGAASVLYGTDAIGGVVNVITRRPDREGVHGLVGYRFGSASELHRTSARLSGREDRVDFSLGGSWRTAGAYEAPSGAFGDITLADDASVTGTGVDDLSLDGRLAFHPAAGHELYVRAEHYRADDAGFGLVDPELYAPGTPRIDITYPEQRFTKVTAGYSAQVGWGLADRFDLTTYAQDNERTLAFDFFQSFGFPGAGITIDTDNYTDLRTFGGRLEAKKLMGSVLLTYGADGFHDDSENTDRTVTTVAGFGPPQVEESDLSNVPNSSYRSLGAFAQAEWNLPRAVTLIGGVRAQTLKASADAAPALNLGPVERTDAAVVASLNAIVPVAERWSLVGSVGRGFRSPNLIEWFFEGPVPEAGAYQVRNPDLTAETSLSLDAGLRYQGGRAAFEVFAFRNKLFDGIRTEVTGDTIQGLAAFQPTNIDELIYRGVEASAEARVAAGFTLAGTYTHLSSEDALRPDSPTGETFSNRVTGTLRWDSPDGRFFAAYDVRHNGEQKDVDLGQNPLGEVLPAFTVQDARLGARLRLGDRTEQRITLGVANLGDRLYAESSNASFFRPEPGRNFTISLESVF